MRNALLKALIIPVGVTLSWLIFPNVWFANFTQVILLSIILALVGIGMEYLFLKRGTLWVSTALDFIGTVIVISIYSWYSVNTDITFFGSILIALILAATEYFVHRWLIKNEETANE